MKHEAESRLITTVPIFKILTAVIFIFYGSMGTLFSNQEMAVDLVEYLYPVDDDTVIPLPFIILSGKLIRHTFPGVPNYESIEDGDYPETRWVLEIGEAEIRQLIASKYVSEEMYESYQEGWVQLIPASTAQSPQCFLNKRVIVKGYLGTLASHIHTPATIEAKEIYDDIQKMD